MATLLGGNFIIILKNDQLKLHKSITVVKLDYSNYLWTDQERSDGRIFSVYYLRYLDKIFDEAGWWNSKESKNLVDPRCLKLKDVN